MFSNPSNKKIQIVTSGAVISKNTSKKRKIRNHNNHNNNNSNNSNSNKKEITTMNDYPNTDALTVESFIIRVRKREEEEEEGKEEEEEEEEEMLYWNIPTCQKEKEEGP